MAETFVDYRAKSSKETEKDSNTSSMNGPRRRWSCFSVPVHIADLGESLEATVEVPGFDENEIDISVELRRLTITGKRATNKEEKKGDAVYSEFCSDQIQRVVDLPASVDARKITAILKGGVLQLTMPKAARTRTIEIKPRAAQPGLRSR